MMNDTSSRFFQKEKRLLSYRCVELLLAVIFIDASVIWCDVPQAIQYRVKVRKRMRNLPFSSSSAAVYLMPARKELILAGTKKTDHPFDPYSIHYIGSWREKASKKERNKDHPVDPYSIHYILLWGKQVHRKERKDNCLFHPYSINYILSWE